MNIRDLNKKMQLNSSILNVIECFEQIIKTSKSEIYNLFFETSIMLDSNDKYFLVSIYVDNLLNNKTTQLILNLKYNLIPTLCIMKNIYYSSNINEFFINIKDSNVVKYLYNEDLKPIDIDLIELEL